MVKLLTFIQASFALMCCGFLEHIMQALITLSLSAHKTWIPFLQSVAFLYFAVTDKVAAVYIGNDEVHGRPIINRGLQIGLKAPEDEQLTSCYYSVISIDF